MGAAGLDRPGAINPGGLIGAKRDRFIAENSVTNPKTGESICHRIFSMGNIVDSKKDSDLFKISNLVFISLYWLGNRLLEMTHTIGGGKYYPPRWF